MGFYLRKAVLVGPFRFNLSKSGIGVSTGVPGLRLGLGPSGKYVHVGRGGLYYRKSLNDASRRPSAPTSSPSPTPDATALADSLVTIESGDVTEMVDSTSSELLAELNLKHSRSMMFPWVAGAGLILAWLLASNSFPRWAVWLLLAAGIVATAVTYVLDKTRKTTVLLYDLEGSRRCTFSLSDCSSSRRRA